MLQLYRRCLLIPGPMSILILEPSLKRTAPLWDITFLWASLIAQLVENLPAMQETWVRSLGWEDPLERGRATHSSIQA